jgi:cytochrome b561
MNAFLAGLRNHERWGPVSQALHWAIALLVFAMAALGLVLDELPRAPGSTWAYDLHKSTGLLVLALMVARLAWRLVAGAPPPIAGMPRMQRLAAGATHGLLYLLVLAMPLSGWLYDAASGLRPLHWFGLFTVPKPVAPDESLADAMHDLHEGLFVVLMVVVAAHVAAAAWHHLFRGDATLARMLPRGWLDAGRRDG